MRVAHLSWEFPPLVHGGLGRHVAGLTEQQRNRGLDVVVLTCRDDVTGAAVTLPPADEHVERAGDVGPLTVHRVGLGRPWGDVVADAARWQRDLTTSGLPVVHGADVLHAHDWMVADATARLAAACGVPWVLTVHATEHGRRHGRLDQPVHHAVHEAERAAVATADRVIVCSQAMREEVVQVLGARPSSVVVVPGGVDAGAWAPAPELVRRADARWRRGGPLVVAAGRLEWEKGFSTLLRATPMLLRRHPAMRVVVAGAGSYRPTLERLRADLGVTGVVELAGRLEPSGLAPLLAASDVTVVPSRYEPFGLVALEAMASGTCVVATRTGGLLETVQDGVTGRLVGVGDVDGLAAVVHELLADPGARAGFAQAGRAAASRRGWDVVADRTLDVYRGLVSSPGRSPART